MPSLRASVCLANTCVRARACSRGLGTDGPISLPGRCRITRAAPFGVMCPSKRGEDVCGGNVADLQVIAGVPSLEVITSFTNRIV